MCSYDNSYLAIELDLLETKVEQDLDYSIVIVVDWIEIDFVLVDYSVDAAALMAYSSMMNYHEKA